jgi:hypothetical protein
MTPPYNEIVLVLRSHLYFHKMIILFKELKSLEKSVPIIFSIILFYLTYYAIGLGKLVFNYGKICGWNIMCAIDTWKARSDYHHRGISISFPLIEIHLWKLSFVSHLFNLHRTVAPRPFRINKEKSI